MRVAIIAVLTVWFVVLAGCGSGGPKLIPVEGIVTLNGQPLEKASVAFLPAQNQPLPASGVTDSEGKFRLVTVVGPQELNGAAPGGYQVIVTKFNQSGITAAANGLSGEIAPGGIQTEWIVPEKYSTVRTSGLKCDVQPGLAPVKFELSGPAGN